MFGPAASATPPLPSASTSSTAGTAATVRKATLVAFIEMPLQTMLCQVISMCPADAPRRPGTCATTRMRTRFRAANWHAWSGLLPRPGAHPHLRGGATHAGAVTQRSERQALRREECECTIALHVVFTGGRAI